MKHFKEINFHQWKVHSGIPREDIVWQNISNLKKESNSSQVKWFLQPLLISSITIFSILLLEGVALHYTPNLSTFILYLTTTGLVFFCFYATPYLVFNSV